MPYPSKLTVILKDDDKKVVQDFLLYEPYSITPDDPEIQKSIAETRKNFQGNPETCQIKVSMDVHLANNTNEC